MSLESTLDRKLKTDSISEPAPNEIMKGCRSEDFDPYIRYGRDNQLFVKRECLDRLSNETRFSEDELNNLMLVYVNFASEKKGLSVERFSNLIASMSGIENHPFNRDSFLFFDRNKDGVVDFNEFIIGLDIVERGSFDEKCAYCFEMYDIYGTGILDIVTLRHLLRRSYSEIIV